MLARTAASAAAFSRCPQPEFDMSAQSRSFLPILTAGAVAPALMLLYLAGFRFPGGRGAEPAPMAAEPAPAGIVAGVDTAVFAGGCFWGVAAGFRPPGGGPAPGAGGARGPPPPPRHRGGGTRPA